MLIDCKLFNKCKLFVHVDYNLPLQIRTAQVHLYVDIIQYIILEKIFGDLQQFEKNMQTTVQPRNLEKEKIRYVMIAWNLCSYFPFPDLLYY